MRHLLRQPLSFFMLVCACNVGPQVQSTRADAEPSDTEVDDRAAGLRASIDEASAPSGIRPSPGRSHEPFILELEGWPPSHDTTDGDHRVLLYDGKEPGCSIRVDRWWGMPPDPGGPMEIASKRPVTVDGRELELIETRAFEGIAQEVEVLFHSGDGFQVRVVFSECSAKTVAKVLDLTRISP